MPSPAMRRRIWSANQWTPKKVTSAQVYLDLDADAIIGADTDAVTNWPDSSGRNHPATEATNAPILKKNILNGHAVVRFNGTSQLLTIASHADFNLTSPWHIFVVSAPASVTGNAEILWRNGDWGIARQAAQVDWVAYGQHDFLTAKSWLTIGAFNIHEYKYDASQNVTFGINGLVKETLTGPGVANTTANNISIGYKSNPRYWGGDIARILIFSGALSVGDLALVRQYLTTRYNRYLFTANPDVATAPAHAATADVTPTYDTSGQAMNPSVVYVAAGWNGYAYWMAMTPYPSSDPDYENPSILASADGATWEVPTGLTNPIVAAPGGGAYNSDTHLFLSPDGTTLYCTYREFRDTAPLYARIYLTTSTNGTTWSAPQLIMQSVATEKEIVMPCFIWDGSQYVCWHTDTSAAPYTLYRRTATAMAGPWSDKTPCSFDIHMGSILSPALYHPDVILESGVYTIFDGSYLGKSTDGIHWLLYRGNGVLFGGAGSGHWDSNVYQACLVRIGADLYTWYCGFDGTPNVWGVGHTTLPAA